MGERITKIDLQAFRAVPGTLAMELTDGRSCVVLGDNGTGKSSIADAIEWYFEGQIEFLRKEGRGNAIRHSGAAKDLDTTVAIAYRRIAWGGDHYRYASAARSSPGWKV